LVYAIIYYIFGEGRSAIKDSKWVNYAEGEMEDVNYDGQSIKRSQRNIPMPGIFSPFSNPSGIRSIAKLLRSNSTFKVKTQAPYDNRDDDSYFQYENASNIQQAIDGHSL